MFCEVKSCMCIINKVIIKMDKLEFYIATSGQNDQVSAEKFHPTFHLTLKSSNIFVLECFNSMLDLWIFISWFRQDDVFTKESNIMDRGLFDGGFVYYKHTAVCFTRRSLMDCSHVDYLWIIGMFYQLSFWRHPFTAEDPLVSKWCNATFLQIIYVKKSFCMSIKNL